MRRAVCGEWVTDGWEEGTSHLQPWRALTFIALAFPFSLSLSLQRPSLPPSLPPSSFNSNPYPVIEAQAASRSGEKD